jgi:hypothetical protein
VKIKCEVTEVTLQGDRGEVDGVMATCSRCDHSTESFGTGDNSVKRCLVLLKEGCPQGENNYYVEE